MPIGQMTKRSDFRDIEIGKRLRALRLRRERSQTSLGDALGVSFQQIQKYERGTNRISASRLQQLADFLAVPITFFYGESETTSKPRPPNDEFDFLQTPSAMRLMRAYARIKKPAVRSRLLGLAECLSSE